MLYNFNSISSHPILKDSKGVYCIESGKGQQYIGSTCVSFKIRWQAHLRHLRNNTHHSKHMQNVYNKHGVEYFSISILYVGEEKEDILQKEQHYIDTVKPIFNTAPIVNSPAGMKQSEETIECVRLTKRRQAVESGSGVQLTPHNNYRLLISLKNHILQISGFLTEQDARDELAKLRNYFWSSEFESKSIVDQDEEVELCKLRHKIRVKTQREPSGVYLDSKGKYRSCLAVDGVTITFGCFTSKEEGEEVYRKNRAIFISEEFLTLSPEDRQKFIKEFRANYYDTCTTTGHRYILYERGVYKFKYERKYQKSFKTLEEAMRHKQEYFASGCTLVNPRKEAGSGHGYIHQDRENSFRFFHKPSNHNKTFRTLDEALTYRDQYISVGNFYETPKRTSNSGHKYITLLNTGKYKFQYIAGGVTHRKTLDTLEEAVAYKAEYLANLKASHQNQTDD